MNILPSLSGDMWLIMCMVFAGGIILGFAGCYFFCKNTSKNRLQSRLDIMQTELDSYHARVNRHFMVTADLVNRLTDDYRLVHRHLASGASELCASQEVQDQLNDSLLSAGSLPSDN